MIGRRLVILKRKHVLRAEAFTYDFAIEVPDFDEVKDVAHKNLKKISYKALVYTLRAYLISLNILKNKYKELSERIKKMKNRNGDDAQVPEIREANKFLKMMTEYKTKITKIKKKIKEEEGLN